MKNLQALIPFLVILVLPLYSLGKEANDGDAKSAQVRMKARIKAVGELKLAGLAGEDKQGLLSFRGKLTEKQQDLLDAENKDRSIIYAVFAKKFNVSVKQVALSRAAKIQKIAKVGTWIQAKDGSWTKKK
jgi:uncharacterized protein YdbL (DUF1318 family)